MPPSMQPSWSMGYSSSRFRSVAWRDLEGGGFALTAHTLPSVMLGPYRYNPSASVSLLDALDRPWTGAGCSTSKGKRWRPVGPQASSRLAYAVYSTNELSQSARIRPFRAGYETTAPFIESQSVSSGNKSKDRVAPTGQNGSLTSGGLKASHALASQRRLGRLGRPARAG